MRIYCQLCVNVKGLFRNCCPGDIVLEIPEFDYSEIEAQAIETKSFSFALSHVLASYELDDFNLFTVELRLSVLFLMFI